MARFLLPSVLACGLALGSTAAMAVANRSGEPVLGTGAPSGKRLTKSQLRQCLDLQARLESQAGQAKRSRADLDAAKVEFDRFDAQLQAERGGLNAGDKAAVDAYNAKLERRRQMVADYNTRAPQATALQQTAAETARSWKSECENRPYDQDDYAELKPSR